MSRISRFRHRAHEADELNITAFLNLMVILIPFLLITAVFSHMTIIELNLPPQAQNQPQDEQKKELNFELIVQQDGLIVADTIGGPIKRFPKRGAEYDFKGLSDLLILLKSKFPEKENLTILLEPKIPYDVLVQAMDTVRVVNVVEVGSVVQKELFPVIAIGDAPAEN
jgi:biopolymer transport protein ExbD